MQRVIIAGGPGSGKSTLALALGGSTGLPVFHMDHIHWQPGWVERLPEDKRRMCDAVHAQERWIFEGTHSGTFDARVARADTLIWLDLPIGLRLWRAYRRSLNWWGRARPGLPPGCPERFGPETSAFWRYTWHTRNTARVPLQALIAAPSPHLTLFHLQSPAQVTAFLDHARIEGPSSRGG
jgi:adenylate kinase family enzyme